MFCIQNCVTIMMIGRTLMGKRSACDRSVTHSQLAPRISTDTVNTL